MNHDTLRAAAANRWTQVARVESVDRWWIDHAQSLPSAFHTSDGIVSVRSTSTTFVTEAKTMLPRHADLARTWLRETMRAQPRMKRGKLERRLPWSHQQVPLLAEKAPIYWDGTGELHDAAYVDIVACYWSLLVQAGALDLDWVPGRRTGYGRYAILWPEAIASEKIARNAIIGLMRKARSISYHYGNAIEQGPEANPWLAPGTWGWINSRTHDIARRAVALGAVMWHTDGGLLPVANAPELVAHIGSLGLAATVTYDPVIKITSLGAYHGEARTTAKYGTRGHALSTIRSLPR